ncbi:MAG: DUF4159 domain-containing protein [Candidatus Latescibacteria bacterium]|nr:DUF4159 domain-containing protein [Candidatus Latescibacterota bacterium]
MKRAFAAVLGIVLSAGILVSCTPIGLQPQTAQEREEAYQRERYQARVRADPLAPQAITGFWRLGRVYSSGLGPDESVLAGGNPRDLDLILDSVNELTNIEAEFAPSIPYGHPGLFDLPIIVPQSTPNETEMEQLSRYLQEGGFCLLLSLNFNSFREALEKYGGLVWGQDMWRERLPEDHPLFAAFFEFEGGIPLRGGQGIASDPQQVAAQQQLQGFFIGGRLVAVHLGNLGPLAGRVSLPGMFSRIPAATRDGAPASVEPPQPEELTPGPPDQTVDFRLQQLLVNVVVYALTEEGSIAQQPRGR